MCGILGIATTAGERLSIDRKAVERMRDLMFHRGPDGSGLWDGGNIMLAHRRLAVVDPTPAGAQPMVTPDGRFALVYNGELYNDRELRGALEQDGVQFRSESDTETVLMALATWGPQAIGQLRGMFALGLFDAREQTLVLARDTLGIKPLYYRTGPLHGQPGVIFASEIPAILAHPDVTARPDLVTVSAYLTTIRTVLGHRTLFQGICTLRPGEVLAIDLKSEEMVPRPMRVKAAIRSVGTDSDMQPEDVREIIQDSLQRHLRSDVPLCCLLSGGLDSSILAALAMRSRGDLRTYCSGAAASCESMAQRSSEDFGYAAMVAAAIGSQHTEVPVTPMMFTTRWRHMVAAMGMPLSTPNEVAIHAVAERLREDGHVVALTGEGADELFGGYEAPLEEALAYTQDCSLEKLSPGVFQLLSNAWIKPEVKPTLFNTDILRAIEGDGHLIAYYDAEFESVAAERHDDSPLQAHLRFHRRINLAGLLQRLDSATMLASVEGRTPFADAAVCALAESLPMNVKFAQSVRNDEPHALRTKRILREAFSEMLPQPVILRPKASFPLPFQDWVAEQAHALQQCGMARELFTPSALHAVSTNPTRVWHLSWPMINIALWAQRWWG